MISFGFNINDLKVKMEKPLLMFKEEWFQHPEWWFHTQPAVDAYLANTYGDWLKRSPLDNSWDNSKDLLMAWVLIYDQLPRHMARVRELREPSEPSKLREPPGEIERYLEKAISLVRMVLDEFEMAESNLKTSPFSFSIDEFTPQEFGFLMLPLRHSKQVPLNHLAMKWSWKKIQRYWDQGDSASAEALKPFLVATYQRSPMLDMTMDLKDDPEDAFVFVPAPLASHTNPKWERFETILDFFPEATLEGEPRPTPPQPLVFKDIPSAPILVSLSGGVDSLVLLWSLLFGNGKTRQEMRRVGTPALPLREPHAIFIHYCNRPDTEEEFIREICRIWGVPLYIRRIREIQRVPAMKMEMRETYETYTRRCRYHAYHHAYQHMRHISGRHIDSTPIIAMGHNKDDCFENILTNLCYRQKYEQLTGMAVANVIEGIQFWRPMLSIPKHQIYDIAKKNGIPYLHDSTPKWCCRGKIRDTIRPPMEALHSNFIESFFDLSETLGEYMGILNATAERLYRQTHFQSTPKTAELIVCETELPMVWWSSVRFWKKYFEYLYEAHTVPSEKSVAYFCERMTSLISLETSSSASIRVYLKKHLEVRVAYMPDKKFLKCSFRWL
jgi:tRNA(Ile)-lysidine synthetase-like protein